MRFSTQYLVHESDDGPVVVAKFESKELADLYEAEFAKMQEVIHWVRETKRIAETSTNWEGARWLHSTDEGCCALEALNRLDGSPKCEVEDG